MSESDISSLTDQLYQALRGSKDDDALINITSQNPLNIRLKIKEKYISLYGKDLIEEFNSKLGGDFKDLMIGLYKSIYEFDSDELKSATKGPGTNDDTLIEIIGSRPNWFLKKVKETYKNKYNEELEKDIIDDTSGDFQKMLVSLLQCSRSENKIPDIEKCKEMARDLFKGDKEKGKIGLDKDKTIKYLGLSSPCELMHLAREFHREYDKSIIKVIKDEYSGDIRQLIITIFYANISPSEYFATRIRKSVDGNGTNERILNRVVITRYNVDMDIIKEYYHILYSRNLVEDVKSDTSGSYQKLLLALIDK